jgi:hypothetical protein
MTDDEQLAQARKYDSALVWCFAEIQPGRFALYDYKRQLVLITDDFVELISAYRARPAYVSPVRVSIPSIKVEINL